jgi:hypothetical protein
VKYVMKKKLTVKEYRKADVRIRRIFWLKPTTGVVLPHGPSRTWIVRLGGLSEDQATAILQAAVDAGVPLEPGWKSGWGLSS